MATIDLFKEAGIVGVPEWNGQSTERYISDLNGPDGIRLMAEVLRREPAAFTVNAAITMAAQNAKWKIVPPSDDAGQRLVANFIEGCFNDMSHDIWEAFSFALSSIAFGYADMEIVYKRRQGYQVKPDNPSSRYEDGLVGLRKLAPRRQETIKAWVDDANGGKQAMIQENPADNKELPPIPIEKLLHFRSGNDRGSWHGIGWLEPGYKIAQMINNYEIILGIGHQRSFVGLPIFGWKAKPEDNERSIVQAIGRNLLVNAQQYVEYPEARVSFKLESVGNNNAAELRLLINQLRWELMSLAMVQFFRLGATESGSRALADPMVGLFQSGIDSALNTVAGVINRHLIPRLLAANPNFAAALLDPPQLAFTPVQSLSAEIMQFLGTAQTFLATAPPEDAMWLRSKIGMPEIDMETLRQQQAAQLDAANRIAAQASGRPSGGASGGAP